MLNDLYDEWICADDVVVNDMAKELNDKIHDCVGKIVIKKIKDRSP